MAGINNISRRLGLIGEEERGAQDLTQNETRSIG